MSLLSTSAASSATVTLSALEIQAGQTLFSSSSGYSVLDFIGEGCFGKVARCQKLATKEPVAVKILKEKDTRKDIENEVLMMEVIHVMAPNCLNIVKFFEHFEYLGQTCLAFEMLDISLYDMLKEQAWRPLQVNQIRPITQQLLVALDALRDIGILHTDIKPDNIMCVNKQNQPLRIKLIDFGQAMFNYEVQTGMQLQPAGYRAPEVSLGLPFTEAVDVWSVGCVLAFLFLADNLFPFNCDYQIMKYMVKVLGQPEDKMLRAGRYTHIFFTEDEAADPPALRLLTAKEYMATRNMKVSKEHYRFEDLPSSLDDLVHIYPKQSAEEFVDRMAFVDLLKQMLHLDGDQRISALQVLQQPFVTMSHLDEHMYSSDYVTTSYAMMGLCTSEDSANRVSLSAALTPEQEGHARSTTRVLAKTFDCPPVLVSYDDGPTTGPSDGVSRGGLPVISYDEVSSVRTSDGEQASIFSDEAPGGWTSDEESSISCDEVSATRTSDEELLSLSSDEDPATWSSDGGLPSCCDDASIRSSDGGKTKRAKRKWLKRIQKVLQSLCCCCCNTVED